MDMERLFAPIWDCFRPARMQQCVSELGIDEETRVLDVGGAERNWRYLSFRPQVTILNIAQEGERRDFPWVFADARALPFPDKAFDVVFSNSAIEHLGNWESQKAMAREICRVGKSYYVQTPNYWFPFDVHMLLPFFHWLPRGLRRWLIRFTPWAYLNKPTVEKIDVVLDELSPLRARQMGELFPDSVLFREKTLGMSKSLICVRSAVKPIANKSAYTFRSLASAPQQSHL